MVLFKLCSEPCCNGILGHNGEHKSGIGSFETYDCDMIKSSCKKTCFLPNSNVILTCALEEGHLEMHQITFSWRD